MLLERLTVCDFRVFAGQHTLELRPQSQPYQRQPVVLFGGLNGAGKTSILTAVRLALYGRQVLGAGTTQASYDAFLAKSIHRDRRSLVAADNASVALDFTYARQGVAAQYKVVRAWHRRGKAMHESLVIEKDGQPQTLNHQQAQGFLNELVPMGVSELFFFDGEKIAELAEDSNGVALAEAIKKLLGLDVVDRLNADLSILVRDHNKQGSNKKESEDINQLEHVLADLEAQADKESAAYATHRVNWTTLKAEYQQLTNELSGRGGDWAASREQEVARANELTVKKQTLENEIKERLATDFPLSLAPDLVQACLQQLALENEIKQHQLKADTLAGFTRALLADMKTKTKKETYQTLKQSVDENVIQYTGTAPEGELVHDLSVSGYQAVEAVLAAAQATAGAAMKTLRAELTTVTAALDEAGRQIARAPVKATLTPLLDAIADCQARMNDVQATMLVHKASAKRYLVEAIAVTRKLDTLHQRIAEKEDKQHTHTRLAAAMAFLNEFSRTLVEQKIQQLEKAFATTFMRLARKEDVVITATIHRENFNVTLKNDAGRSLHRDELSAGEKQIYAIAMLEALARTSGRSLPIIIDTPLGRLDSHHRRNLVEQYFPYASQQVIILSTDEEVDEAFYQALDTHISHAYLLEYDAGQGASVATKGYFWKVGVAA